MPINYSEYPENWLTETIAFRVLVELAEPIKKLVKDYIAENTKGI